MESKYFIGQADLEDLGYIAAIEKEFFDGYSRIFDKLFLRKWYEHNPAMFRVIKNPAGCVLGFFIVCPITLCAYERMIAGEVSDLYDISPKDVHRQFDSDYYYIADLCVSKSNKGLQYFRVATTLMREFVFLLNGCAKYVVTSPITPEGIRITQKLGGAEVATQMFEGNSYAIYQLEWTDEIRKKYEKRFHVNLQGNEQC